MKHVYLVFLSLIFYNYSLKSAQVQSGEINETYNQASVIVKQILLYQALLLRPSVFECYVEIGSVFSIIESALKLFLNPNNVYLKDMSFENLNKTCMLTLPNLLITELVQPSLHEICLNCTLESIQITLHNQTQAKIRLCELYKGLAPIVCTILDKKYNFESIVKTHFTKTYNIVTQAGICYSDSRFQDLDMILVNEYIKRYLVNT
jgi:hypothetical protein